VIRLTTHAWERVATGEVALEWIERTVLSPEFERTDVRRPTTTLSFRAIPEFGNRTLRVAHRPEKDDVLVITAFFDRGARR